ncbi:MAG TPA: GspH/FimT family pseudopilin [Vicinamibacterales bacterium]|nr:GspH/FimT family pseudopilin [Vicinamibacterales bacterium]
MCRDGIRHGERGFSLTEILVVASLSMVLMAMALMQISTSRATMNADNAMRLIMAELNRARDTAVAQRRNVQVTFVGSNEIRVSRLEIPLGTTLLRRAVMEGNIRFLLPSGTPDTTDAFGAGSALDFDGNGTVIFNGDGMLVDSSGTVINGTVFLAAPNDQFATRAVTILGSTGRVRAYRMLNTIWGRV